jgi:hypothetical protein
VSLEWEGGRLRAAEIDYRAWWAGGAGGDEPLVLRVPPGVHLEGAAGADGTPVAVGSAGPDAFRLDLPGPGRYRLAFA